MAMQYSTESGTRTAMTNGRPLLRPTSSAIAFRSSMNRVMRSSSAFEARPPRATDAKSCGCRKKS